MVEQPKNAMLVAVCRSALIDAAQKSQTALQHRSCLVQICADTLPIDLQGAAYLCVCAAIVVCNLAELPLLSKNLRQHGFKHPFIFTHLYRTVQLWCMQLHFGTILIPI